MADTERSRWPNVPSVKRNTKHKTGELSVETSSLDDHCCLPELDIVWDALLHMCNRVIYVDFDGNVLRGQITYNTVTHF